MPEREAHANGYKPKAVQARVGKITFDVPQVRAGIDGHQGAKFAAVVVPQHMGVRLAP